jgi:hypothetical protein
MRSPQQLNSQALAEFRAAYEEEFGETISDDEAREMAFRLLRFFGVLDHPRREEMDQ